MLNKKYNKELSFGFIGLKEKAVFFRNLAIMFKSGLTVNEALEILEDQAVGKFKRIIRNIQAVVASGNSLAFALAKHPKVFSGFLVNIVRAGEASGTLNGNLENIAEQLTREKELVDKIRGALFYPIIVLILSFILGLVLAFYILPKITPLLKGLKVELPASTKLLIYLSSLIEAHGFLIFGIIVGGAVFLIWALRLKAARPFTHLLILKIPIIRKLSRNRNLAQFSHTLGTLLKSGLNIDEALSITADTVNNHYYKRSINAIRIGVSQGTKISDNLQKYNKYFPKMATSMIRVGEKSGKLEEELFNLSRIYESEVNNASKTLSSAIEPILLIFIGVVVGGLALSIITPIYKITGNIYR